MNHTLRGRPIVRHGDTWRMRTQCACPDHACHRFPRPLRRQCSQCIDFHGPFGPDPRPRRVDEAFSPR